MIRKRSSLKPQSLIRRKRRRLILQILLVIILLALVATGVWYGSRIHALQIQNTMVSGNVSVDTAEIQTIVNNNISGTYWKFFPRSNVLWYPRKAIAADIAAEYPVFDTVNVHISDFHNLVVTVHERAPAALWCKSQTDPTALVSTLIPSDDCYLMDQTGYVYAPAPDFSGQVYLRYYGLITADDPIRQTFTVYPSLPDLADFVSEISQQNNFTVTGIFARGNGEYELHLQNNGIIIFSNSQDLATTFTNLETLLDQSGLSTSTSSTFQYIDLRFGNKVYYRGAQ
jgi:cell division septal protein FtsQ